MPDWFSNIVILLVIHSSTGLALNKALIAGSYRLLEMGAVSVILIK